ncbi:hypothetical protein ASG40_19375 [Methylobacterium sp. Leaf399]|nr:hypothetical protein ASG40_19375 [Methylobacterium sp. Leaf399]
MLDRQIAAHGQDVTLRRIVANASAIEKPSRAFVRGYRPDELTGGIQQGDSLLTLSPSSIPAEFSGAQDRLRMNDRIVVSGRTRNVQYVDPVEIAGAIVRYNVVVRG